MRALPSLIHLTLVAIVLACSAWTTQAQTPAASVERVAWVVLVDDLHVDFRNTGRSRQLLQTFLKEVVRQGDLVAIRTTGPSAVLTGFRSGHELLPFVRNVSGGGLRPQELLNKGWSDDVQLRTRVSLSSATAAAAVLGQVELERRALLYISNGYGFEVKELIEVRALASVARASGVRIFTIDAASLDRLPQASTADPAWQAHRAAERNSLQVIAEQGGGLAILDVQNGRAAFEQINSRIRQR